MKTNKYIERFLNSFSSECIIGVFSRYKNVAKEITESYSLLEAARRFVPNVNECVVIIVGDGCSPRTGVMFSYFTKAEVISVDPGFNLTHWEDHVDKQTKMGFPPQRIKLIKDKIENVEINCEGKRCVVVWPHSHADMLDTNIKNYQERVDIALPCCVPIPSKLMEIPHIVYEDNAILSPKKIIHIWSKKD